MLPPNDIGVVALMTRCDYLRMTLGYGPVFWGRKQEAPVTALWNKMLNEGYDTHARFWRGFF